MLLIIILEYLHFDTVGSIFCQNFVKLGCSVDIIESFF